MLIVSTSPAPPPWLPLIARSPFGLISMGEGRMPPVIRRLVSSTAVHRWQARRSCGRRRDHAGGLALRSMTESRLSLTSFLGSAGSSFWFDDTSAMASSGVIATF
jgi:hypothetical protein